MTEIKLFGIRLKENRKLLRWEIQPEPIGSIFPYDSDEMKLIDSDDAYLGIWLVSDKKTAERVLHDNDPCPSHYTCPIHDYRPEELEVVEFRLQERWPQVQL